MAKHRHTRHHTRLSIPVLPATSSLSLMLSWSRACTRSPSERERGEVVDFVAVLDQVIALLRQRGRLTYRTLQLQFQLDETQLEVLKDELVYGQCVAVDEAGRVLVWTGEIGRASCRERV